jgi:hypothetical protein
MTATRKIAEAEAILARMHVQSGEGFQATLGDFLNAVHDVFSHLLDEYNLKFDCKIDRVSLEKFKTKAKKMGNINAINFLIWYDKEYRRVRDGPSGHLLEKYYLPNYADRDGIINGCTALLNDARAMAYNAYENF